MQAIERKIVRAMVKRLGAIGWKPVSVFDGGEQVPAITEKAVLEAVDSVDDSTVTFAKEGCINQGVLLVLGNGEDVVSDYNCRYQDFNQAMDSLMEIHS